MYTTIDYIMGRHKKNEGYLVVPVRFNLPFDNDVIKLLPVKNKSKGIKNLLRKICI